MWLRLIGSPVTGWANRQSSAASCCRSKTAARLASAPGERRVLGDVADQLAVEPHGPAVPQPLDVLLAVACGHRHVPPNQLETS